VFAYAVPSALEGKILPGQMVEAPFRTTVQAGIVLALHEHAEIADLKALTAILHPEPVLSDLQIALARWMSAQSLTPIGMCVWSFLPPGMMMARDVRVTLRDAALARGALEKEILALLEKRGTLQGRQLDLALPGRNWRAAVDDLARAGAVDKVPFLLPARARPKQVQVAALAIPPAQIDDLLAKLRNPETPRRILNLLARERGQVDVGVIYAQADAALTDLKRLQKHGLIVLGARESLRDSLAGREFVPSYAPALTPEQAVAWEKISAAIRARGENLTPSPVSVRGEGDQGGEAGGKTFLLQGVTGSGKTELYLRAIGATLAQGRDAIYLVPEIALTAQTVQRVAARFPGEAAIVHSKLSDGERYDTWRRARAGEVHIAVGARSAIFTPLRDVGLIILDEEHDTSYQQGGEQLPPHYHARAVAEEMARLNDAVVLLGSATPALETRYRAEQGQIERLLLPTRIHAHRQRIHEQELQMGIRARYVRAPAPEAMSIDLPPVDVVDMRAELKAGNTSIFSRALQEQIAGVLARKEQALLLMNRRGQSTYVFCRECGYVATCPRCDTPLTHHRDAEALRCHHCGHTQPAPGVCPACGSKRIKYFGAGTQQVEAAVKAAFPTARVLRWDADSATTPGAHEAILQHFIDQYADIIVGTQMIAKGLDLPMVTLVGVVSADISLNLPDFRAAERSFQLLTQMAGRAGRGLLGGRVIVQSYEPDHYVIRAAAAHDTEGFYAREIAYRRELGYPPFRRLARLVFAHPQEGHARAEAERAAGMLMRHIRQHDLVATELIGPAPCFFARVDNRYRWHLMLRSPDPVEVLRGLELPPDWNVEIDPVDTL
jgi:primosomal protein N' (replication factor Y)